MVRDVATRVNVVKPNPFDDQCQDEHEFRNQLLMNVIWVGQDDVSSVPDLIFPIQSKSMTALNDAPYFVAIGQQQVPFGRPSKLC
jgi:hypothetical protein